VSVYPGGHPDHLSGKEGLAVYVHSLTRKGALNSREGPPQEDPPPAPALAMVLFLIQERKPLKLKISVVNHNLLDDPIEWSGTLEPGVGNGSWGPNDLLSIKDLRNKDKGWLNKKGALVLMVAAVPTDEGRDSLSSVKSEGSTKRKLSDPGEVAQSVAKKVRASSSSLNRD
ncbi:hypothetical protein FOZ62_003841, partial [Perkinsus olseni]